MLSAGSEDVGRVMDFRRKENIWNNLGTWGSEWMLESDGNFIGSKARSFKDNK